MNRREFLQKAGVATMASLYVAGGGPFGIESAFAASERIAIAPTDKALVFIMLDGGNDSYNMLVPVSSKGYGQYRKSRSNLALEERDLLPLNGYQKEGSSYGLHPSMKNVRTLFAKNKLAFLANVGPMIKPVTKSTFQSNTVPLPLGLMSHSDQFKHWQTARPGERVNKGWFGSLGDALQKHRPQLIPMNISLAGSNIMQNGAKTSEYTITAHGSQGMKIYEDTNELNPIIRENFNRIVNVAYDSPFKKTYLSSLRLAQQQHDHFSRALSGIHVPTRFSDTALSQQLKMVAQSIKAAPALGARNQTYFVRYIGWDHHDELLNNHARMLQVLDNALGEFQAALEAMNIANNVVTFTGSDFGRTLTSNGNGTDHGWGGNTIVMGNNVNGGAIYGSYPSLRLNSDLDIGNGVLIPTTATDELYAELALWYGVAKADLPRLLPNVQNFYDVRSSAQPLGIMRG